MKVSVIIPCLNNASTLAIQLEALAAQQYAEPWEVIVADNGSTDATVAIAEQFGDRLPNLRVLDASRIGGSAHARNMAAAAARGEFLLFCDGDDEVGAGWVAAMVAALEKSDLVGGYMEYWRLNEPWLVRAYGYESGLKLFESGYLKFASGCNLGIRRVVHEAVGGFDETLLRLQDVDYSWRVQQAGFKLSYAPDAIVHFRLRGSIRSVCRRAFKFGYTEPFLYQKHRDRGMPQILSWKSIAKTVALFPVRLIGSLRDRALLCKVLMEGCWRGGELYGCIKHRYLPL
ncbi:Poly-beta-1,6-N-acetyl-D-glucosamine synthase [Leptolyngbya sp. O-77]|nr:Poly-beta-1,6-N-acetyl-D-glucosamine synthase [Leptolyngbya sp. O-77]